MDDRGKFLDALVDMGGRAYLWEVGPRLGWSPSKLWAMVDETRRLGLTTASAFEGGRGPYPESQLRWVRQGDDPVGSVRVRVELWRQIMGEKSGPWRWSSRIPAARGTARRYLENILRDREEKLRDAGRANAQQAAADLRQEIADLEVELAKLGAAKSGRFMVRGPDGQMLESFPTYTEAVRWAMANRRSGINVYDSRMARVLATADDLVSQAKALSKGRPTGEFDDEARTVTWIMTTGTEDRDGETVDPEGGDFGEFMRNPVVAFNHDTDDFPIGRLVGEPWVAEVDGRKALLGKVYFSKENPKGDLAYRMAKEGTLGGGSISFLPLGEVGKNDGGGNHYSKWKLLEFTVCPVGSNPDAVRLTKMMKARDNTTYDDVVRIMRGLGYSQSGGQVSISGTALKVELEFDDSQVDLSDVDKVMLRLANLHPKRVGPYVVEVPVPGQNSKNGEGQTYEVWGIKGTNTVKLYSGDTKPTPETVRRLAEKGDYDEVKIVTRPVKLRRMWAKGKSVRLLKADGEIDPETQEYLEGRGLDDVQMVDEEPEDMAEEKTTYTEQGYTIQTERLSSGWMWEIKDGGRTVDRSDTPTDNEDEAVRQAREAVQLFVEEYGKNKATPGSAYDLGYQAYLDDETVNPYQTGSPEADEWQRGYDDAMKSEKAEGVADDVAARAEELEAKGVEPDDAMDAAIEERLVPVGMRKAVRALVKQVDPDKACQMLRDGEVDGRPLTEAQRGMFGAACARRQNFKVCKSCTRRSLCRSCTRRFMKSFDEGPVGLCALKRWIKMIEDDVRGIEKEQVLQAAEKAVKILKAAMQKAYGDETDEEVEKGEDDWMVRTERDEETGRSVYVIVDTATDRYVTVDGKDQWNSRAAAERIVEGAAKVVRSKRLSKAQGEVVTEVAEFLDDAADASDTPKRLKMGMRKASDNLKGLLQKQEEPEEEEELTEEQEAELERMSAELKNGEASLAKALYRATGRRF